MIAWSTLNPGLLALFARLAVDPGQPALVPEHADRPRAAIDPKVGRSLSMEIRTVRRVGRDEEREESVPADATGPDLPWAGNVRRTLVGHRVVTVRLVCDAVVNTDDAWAWATISRIHSRISRRTTDAELKRLGASFNRDLAPPAQANFKKGGHVLNRVFYDLLLNVVVNDVEADPIGWIAQVEVTGHAEDTSGAELPPSMQLDQALIPDPIPS